MDSDFRFGYRIVGKTSEPRRLVDAGAAFAAYAACDPRAECSHEAYLSAFRFASDFRQHLEMTGSTAGFAGPSWSPWLWFDIDADELQHAHKDAGALAAFLVERYDIDASKLLLFFSGSKGFHIGLPTTLWLPPPAVDFHKTARRYAERAADLAAVTVDTGVYDKVRAFRAPNSRHPKTGLHKRRLSYDELLEPLDAILELAKTPTSFDVPTVATTSEMAAADWKAAVELVAREGEAKVARSRQAGAGTGRPTLNRATLEFMRDGAATGDRHRLLFSAAANLAEFGCPPALAVALLEEAALDSGLPPKDVRRQIECGLVAAGSGATQRAAAGSTNEAQDDSILAHRPEAATSDSRGLAGQTCQQVTEATETATPVDVQAALARLWQSTPASKADHCKAATGTRMPTPKLPAHGEEETVTLPHDPPPLISLPAALGVGRLARSCRCGSREYVEVQIGENRTRYDCRKCGRFVGFGRWYNNGGQAV